MAELLADDDELGSCGLTLAAIEIAIHYYYTPVDIDLSVKGVARSIKSLIVLGLLEPCPNDHGSYKATDRCGVYVEAIRALPLPVQKWVMP